MHDRIRTLEVKYGSFACRLEGFDDPMPVMKEVVSYFHELAGHDRFMDMDPQAPEIDRLEDLASEAAEAPVEAEFDDITSRLSLRLRRDAADEAEAGDDWQEAEDNHAEYAAAEAEELDDDATEEGEAYHYDEDALETEADEFDGENAFEADAELDDVAAEIEAAEEAQDSEEDRIESIAARLARIREVVDSAPPRTPRSRDASAPETPAGQNPLAARLADLARRKSELRMAAEHDLAGAVEEDDGGFDAGDIVSNELRPRALPDTEDAVSRILSRTVQEIDDPEARRHRDAIGEMRAAVAATEADSQLGGRPSSRDPEDEFRDDLKAREPLPLTRPVAAPLRLVAAQRVEEDDGSTRARLRRITSGHEGPMATEEADFSDFAERHGAADLDEMIEAAAAFIVDVEGEADFSRPQVMRKVESVIGDSFSREEGLRTFGRMLRMNQIVKLSNGRFQAHPDSRYRA